MRTSEFESKLREVTSQERVMVREPMNRHITFRVGGPADYFVVVNSKEEIRAVVKLCEENGIAYYILGNGSNILIGDKGYRGVILQVRQGMSQITVKGAKLYAQAGALLSQIAKEALNSSLTGFEFASGIPGTLGGACVMNAGAYGGEMKDVLEQVTVLDENRELRTLSNEELELGYRTSVVAKKGILYSKP